MRNGTKPERRPRGRPRAYDAEKALAQAMGAFWDAGYAATSLDDISAATGMNRPSLYAAFGDKQAIYLKAIERYRAGPALQIALSGDGTLRDALRRAYKAALAVYVSGDRGQRGCFVIGTAATEAVGNPVVRKELAGVLRDVDEAFEERIQRAGPKARSRPMPIRRHWLAPPPPCCIAFRSAPVPAKSDVRSRRWWRPLIAMICGPEA